MIEIYRTSRSTEGTTCEECPAPQTPAIYLDRELFVVKAGGKELLLCLEHARSLADYIDYALGRTGLNGLIRRAAEEAMEDNRHG